MFILTQNSSSQVDHDKVTSLLSNAPPHGHGYQIHSELNSLDLTNLTLEQQQQFALKVIQTSCQTKLVQTPKVSPHNLILFIRWVWKNYKCLITTPVLKSLVSSMCSSESSHLKLRKNDILFLWDLLKNIGHYQTGLLNPPILNHLIQFFSIIGREGKSALEVFHMFELFQCVPNQDTYYFTLQALLTTTCSADIIHQASSICQNLLLLLHRHSSSQGYTYTYLPPSPDDVTASEDFRIVMLFLSGTPPPLHTYNYKFNRCFSFTCLETLHQHQPHFLLKIIETSCQTVPVETPKVSPHNLIHFIKWAFRSNSHLITTPVLESLVSAICHVPTKFDVELRQNDILFLWDLLKHIGHSETGLLNTQILNQLLDSFGYVSDLGKTALQVFHKFEVFQCVPNQDSYIFTLEALFKTTSCSADMLQQAASICQKIVLHPETLLPDDGEIIGVLLDWSSKNNMIKEAYAIYLAAKEKRKTNPNWSLDLDMLLTRTMMNILCSKKETVYLALQMLIDFDILEEVEHWEEGWKSILCNKVVNALCRFEDFDAAKQLIFKMIEHGPLPYPSQSVFDIIISACVKARETGRALEMVMLLESIGLYTSNVLRIHSSDSFGMKEAGKILEEARKKDSKLIIALLYHSLIVGYCKLHNFDKALKLLTQMKNFGVSCTNLDELHKLVHSLCLKAMDRKMTIVQLEEMEPMDREMAENQLPEMNDMDMKMAWEHLEEMYLNIMASFDRRIEYQCKSY